MSKYLHFKERISILRYLAELFKVQQFLRNFEIPFRKQFGKFSTKYTKLNIFLGFKSAEPILFRT